MYPAMAMAGQWLAWRNGLMAMAAINETSMAKHQQYHQRENISRIYQWQQ